MNVKALQVRDLARSIAQHMHAPTLQTDTACLATQNPPANRPDPMQKLNRVPKREPCGDKLQRRYFHAPRTV